MEYTPRTYYAPPRHASKKLLWESIRVRDDPASMERAYSALCAAWGRLGGTTTAARYGPEWYRTLALARHGRIGTEERDARLAAMQYAYQDTLSGGRRARRLQDRSRKP